MSQFFCTNSVRSTVIVFEQFGTLLFQMGANHLSLKIFFGVFCSLVVLLVNSHSPEVQLCHSIWRGIGMTI